MILIALVGLSLAALTRSPGAVFLGTCAIGFALAFFFNGKNRFEVDRG